MYIKSLFLGRKKEKKEWYDKKMHRGVTFSMVPWTNLTFSFRYMHIHGCI